MTIFKNRTFLILVVCCFLGNGAFAQTSHFYQVTSNSRTQGFIDQAVKNIFSSLLGKDLCKLFQQPAILSHTMGVTLQTAIEIYSNCPTLPSKAMTLPKIFPKQYFISFVDSNQMPIQSWTTTDNKTVFFVNREFTSQELEKIIVHEMAIALDAKMGLLLSTYFGFEELHSKIEGDTQYVVIPKILTDEEERLSEALLLARYKPIALAFATLRAFNVEKIMAKEELSTVSSQQLCASLIRELSSFFVSFSDNFKEEGSVPQKLLEKFADVQAPHDIDDSLRKILDPNLKLISKNKEISFCEYMATPLLSTKIMWSLFAHGPRPRVTGGWGPQESTGMHDGQKLQILFNEAMFNGSTEQPVMDRSKLNELIKQDVFEKKLKESRGPLEKQ